MTRLKYIRRGEGWTVQPWWSEVEGRYMVSLWLDPRLGPSPGWATMASGRALCVALAEVTARVEELNRLGSTSPASASDPPLSVSPNLGPVHPVYRDSDLVSRDEPQPGGESGCRVKKHAGP